MAHPLAHAEARLVRGDAAGAEADIRRVLEEAPGDSEALRLLGLVHAARGEWADAMTALSTAVRSRPGDVDALVALAGTCNQAGEPELALAASRQALGLAPGSAGALVEEGRAWRALGDTDAARRAFEQAGAYAPARVRLAELALAEGDLATGLAALEARRACAPAPGVPGAPGEPWDGAPRPGARLLVTPEQRPADLVFAARFLPRLAERFAHVLVLAPAPLSRLLASADPRIEVVTSAARVRADVWAPALSLPRLLGVRTLADLPPAPWLHVERAGAGGGRPRVGVHSAGDAAPPPRADQRAPLAAFAPLLEVPEIDWVSLHPAGDGESAERGLATPVPAAGDALDLARAIAGLDAVVATDSLAAHVAAALGVPTCVLTGPAPDWRWCGWYPGATACAQLEPGNWYGAIAAAAGALLALAGDDAAAGRAA